MAHAMLMANQKTRVRFVLAILLNISGEVGVSPTLSRNGNNPLIEVRIPD